MVLEKDKRFKFVIEYDGNCSEVGWQSQPEKISVQSILSDAFFKLTQERVVFYGAGRTDKGVSAFGQVAHLNMNKSFCLRKLKLGMNFYLIGKGVVITEVEEVDSSFHARFSAKRKEYKYSLLCRPSYSVMKTKAWHIRKPICAELIEESLARLIGVHDFSSFRDSSCQSHNPVKEIYKADCFVNKEDIDITFVGNSFLHHQVRIMIGTVVQVGIGKITLQEFDDIFSSKNRRLAGCTAPANGLSLIEVIY